jgi:dTMP kinase
MKIRRVLSEVREGISPKEELSWFINDRKEDISKNIMPALLDNKVVIMDRYYFSTAAYQGALGLNPEDIRTENENFAPIPDRVLIFLTSPDVCLERIESSRDQKSAFEKIEYLQNVETIFKSFVGPNISFINSIGSVSEVHKQVLTEVKDIFNFVLKK